MSAPEFMLCNWDLAWSSWHITEVISPCNHPASNLFTQIKFINAILSFWQRSTYLCYKNQVALAVATKDRSPGDCVRGEAHVGGQGCMCSKVRAGGWWLDSGILGLMCFTLVWVLCNFAHCVTSLFINKIEKKLLSLKFQWGAGNGKWGQWNTGGGEARIYLSFKWCARAFEDILKVCDYPGCILHGKPEGTKHNYSTVGYHYKLLTKDAISVWHCREVFISIKNLRSQVVHDALYFSTENERTFGVCIWYYGSAYAADTR